MKQFQYNKVLIAFIFVGLVAALLIDVARWRAEEVNKQVDLAIDYEDLVQLAEQEGKPVPEVLQAAKEAGITSLAVYETTFKKLNANGKATALAGSELVANYHAGILTDPAWRTLIENGTIKGSDVCVVGHDARTYKEVKEDLLRRLGAARVSAVTVEGAEILVVKAKYETFLKIESKLSDAQSAFAEAKGQLRDGRGNVLGRFDKLKTLGAKTKKTLPTALQPSDDTPEDED